MTAKNLSRKQSTGSARQANRNNTVPQIKTNLNQAFLNALQVNRLRLCLRPK